MTTDYPERLKNFFNELETRRALLTSITDIHNKLINHFTCLDDNLARKSLTLDTQIEKFKIDTEKTLEALRLRENCIPEKEVTLAGRVEQLKDSGIRDIENGSSFDSEEKTMSDWLRMWFRRMDSKGLMRFLLAKRKESVAVRAEIGVATEEAVDLLGFLLEAVEDFVELKVRGEKVKGMADRRWACGILIQAALPLPGGRESLHSPRGVARSLKERAAKVLEKWKGVLGGGEGSDGVGSGETTMFLQMVIGFGLKERFEDEFLRNLVLEFASRREMAKLAVALGFGDKMRDIIEELVKMGKEIEAVYFASEAGLTELFPPVTLLKSSLRKCRKTSNNSTSKDDPLSEDSNNELSAIRAIIRCVEDHKLESQFTINHLQKRLTELEKIKEDKKKTAAVSTSKPSNKRLRGERGGVTSSSRPPKSVRLAIASAAARQRNHPPPPTHQPPAGRFSAPYSYTSPSAYESGPTAPSYGVGYSGAGTLSPVRYGLQYANPSQDIGVGGTRAGGSYGQSNYGAYDYSAPAAPSAPTYPATYKL